MSRLFKIFDSGEATKKGGLIQFRRHACGEVYSIDLDRYIGNKNGKFLGLLGVLEAATKSVNRLNVPDTMNFDDFLGSKDNEWTFLFQ
jgi:hypothetical protein